MGQRSQLIVKLPAKYLNENNPNNKPMRLKVYHNQWLYGSHFIQYLARLLKAIQHYGRQETNFERDAEDILDKAIKYCNSADIDYLTNTNLYDSKIDNYNNDFAKSKDVLDWLNSLNNDNGYMFIDMTNNHLKYCIVNGSEDNEEIKIRTAREYINLFYKDEEIINKTEWQLLRAMEVLKNFKTTDIFKDLEKFKTELFVKEI